MIHRFRANRYDTEREDGRRVEMMQIWCQPNRVQLPKGHKAIADLDKITCYDCLQASMIDFLQRATYCKQVLTTMKYVKPTGFKHPKPNKRTGFKFENVEIDPEILARIEAGV